MDDTSPKISFIPKGSLVHEESFLERPRPRSAIGIAAIFIFAVAVLSYIGLYFYNNILEGKISDKLGEIEKVQRVFSDSPQVAKANDFRFRAEIVRQLLDAHVEVSPIFKFLSENTLGSIMYNKFSFTKEGDTTVVKLSGEAPAYASLAYQRELFSQKSRELSGSSVSNVALTSFGTVSFDLSLSFTPDYLLYSKNVAGSVAPVGLPAAIPSQALVLPVPAVGSSSAAPVVPSISTPLGSGTGTRVTLPPAIPPATNSDSIAPTIKNVPGTMNATSTGGLAAGSSTIVGAGAVVPPPGAGGGAPQNVSVPAIPPATPIAAARPTFWASFWSWFKFW